MHDMDFTVVFVACAIVGGLVGALFIGLLWLIFG